MSPLYLDDVTRLILNGLALPGLNYIFSYALDGLLVSVSLDCVFELCNDVTLVILAEIGRSVRFNFKFGGYSTGISDSADLTYCRNIGI